MEGRSNVFLTAALRAASETVPVRIRNISGNGALIDGRSSFSPGTKVTLMRGRLSVEGKLAWHERRFAGIEFDCPIDVTSWVRRIGHAGQQTVDAIVAAVKEDEPASPVESSGETSSLGALSAELDSVCERLANMEDTSLDLDEELVKLDAIAVGLRRIVAQQVLGPARMPQFLP